jgi:glycosyltransferase involved in cell wall biosynthesis
MTTAATDSNNTTILVIHPGSELYGADKNILRAVVALRDAGYNCLFLIGSDGPLRKKALAQQIECEVFPFAVLRKADLTPVRIVKYCISFIKTLMLFGKLIQERNIRVIHSNTVTLLIGAFFYGKNRPFHIWHVRETIDTPAIMKWFFYLFVRNRSNLILCVSKATQNAVSSVWGNPETPVIVLNNGIDPLLPHPEFSMRWKDTSFCVGMVGRFNSGKGQISLAQAIRELRSRDRNLSARFIFLGGIFRDQTYWRDRFFDFIEREKLNNLIEVIDFTEEVTKYYRKMDLFVLPSTKPDSFPTVVLEAISVGVPVVGYANGGITEMLADDPECLVPMGDYRALAGIISAMMSNNEYRFKKAQNQYRRFEHEYTIESFRHNIVRIYREHTRHYLSLSENTKYHEQK